MALHYYDIDSYKWVETSYNNTPPVREREHGTKRDIRPIGDRAYKWAHIHKFSENCYGLFDGVDGDPVWRWRAYPTTTAESKKLCPILWERHSDGRETVTIRNGSGSNPHNRRYSFLQRYLPRALRFENRNGKHFIYNSDAGSMYYLAKSRTITAARKQHIDRGTKNWWLKKERFISRDDGAALTFERRVDTEIARFAFVGGGLAVPKPPRTVVRKSEKAKHKQAIKDFWEFACAMGPMMPIDSYQYRYDLRKELIEHSENYGGHPPLNNMWNFTLPPEFVRKILRDDNHPMRLNLLVEFVKDSDIQDVNTAADAQRVREQYNRWINKVCGFTKQI
jgi:hypothetical protein